MATIALLLGVPLNVLNAVTNGIQNSDAFALSYRATLVAWQTVFGTAPASVTVLIQTSLDGVSWNTQATSTSTAGEGGTFITAAPLVRARVSASSGGSTTTVIINSKSVTYEASSSGGSAGAPGGASGDIQYNSAGLFGGITPGTGIATFLATPASANIQLASLGIGIAPTTTLLEIQNTVAIPTSQIKLRQASADANAAVVQIFKARGTPGSEGQVLNGDTIFQLAGFGYQATGGYATSSGAAINLIATEDQTSTAHGMRLSLFVAPNGSTSKAQQLSISSSQFVVGSCITPASSGVRFLCISTAGVITSQAAACVGT